MSKLNTFILIILVSLTTGCGKNKEDAPSKTEKTLTEISENINEANSKSEKNKDLSAAQLKPVPENLQRSKFPDKVCDLLNNREIANPFIVGKYFTENALNRNSKLLNQLTANVGCIKSDIVSESYPIAIVQVESNAGVNLIFGFHFDKNQLIDSMSFVTGSKISVEMKLVETSKENKLATFFIGNKDRPLRTIYIRTPYFHTNLANYFNYFSIFHKKGFNIVIQENRGAHLSDGDFKWLHRENIIDGKKTVEWITEQSFNNGQVIPWGISYDGFNALATAASNAEGIIGTIACSAPANASTDSFSSNQKVESALLQYVSEREDRAIPMHFYHKFRYVIDNYEDGFENIDKYIFGRKLADWVDYVESAKDNSNKYWSDRTIIDDLKKVENPIMHIAGFKDDQDSRDTILAYNELKTSQSINKHFFYLHKDGHGCGDFLTTSSFDDFTSGSFEKVPRTSVYSLGDGKQLESTGFYTGSIGNNEILDIAIDSGRLNDAVTYTEDDSKAVLGKVRFEANTIINGMPVFKILGEHKTMNAFVLVSLYIQKLSGKYELVHNVVNNSSRHGLNIASSPDEIVPFSGEIILPPVNKVILAGESLVVMFSAVSRWVIDMNIQSRKEYYTKNGSGVIDFKKVTLELPVESIAN